MYPSLHNSSTVGVPSLSNQNDAVRDHQHFPEQPNARHFTANGPATLTTANSSVLPVLRVRVAEQLSLTPPVSSRLVLLCYRQLTCAVHALFRLSQVMVSAQLGNIPRTDFAQSYDFEHQVLRDYPLDSQLPSAEGDTDTATAEIQRYTQLGHEREAVIMALVAVQTVVDKDTQVQCL